jgi:hypothetical protein
MTTSPLRLVDAQEQRRRLEQAIFETGQKYAGVDGQALSAYLRPAIEDLLSLRARIDAALGLQAIASGAASLWLTLKGGHVGDGRAPIHVIGRMLEAIQAGARQVAAFLETGAAVTHRIPLEIEQEASLDMIALAPGSARIAVSPSSAQLRVDRPLPLAEAALQRILETAAWAEQERDDDLLDALLPDPTLRRQVLSRLKAIAPSQRAEFDYIELSGPLVQPDAEGRKQIVTPRAYVHASSYLRRRQEEHASFRGQLVLIDVEKNVFDLRFEARRIHCRFGHELLAAAKELLEGFVEVAGVGLFHEDEEVPYLIRVEAIRKLSQVEQVHL